MLRRHLNRLMVLLAMVVGVWASQSALGGSLPVPSTLEDFFLPGTQPDVDGTVLADVESSSNCAGCHGGFDVFGVPLETEPYRNWAGSMMAQAGRDPVFYACLTIANQDATQNTRFGAAG